MRELINIIESRDNASEKLAVLSRHILRAGTFLYHGTNTRNFEIPDGPAWFALDRNTAKNWGGWGGDKHTVHGSGSPRIHIYEVISDIDLVNIENFPDTRFGKNDYESFAHDFCGDDGWYTFAKAVSAIDNGWWSPEEIMLGKPQVFLKLRSVEPI